MSRSGALRHTVTLALVSGTVLAVPPAASAAPTCFREVATIVGTPGDDHLVGTAGRDVIVGGGGWDEIAGRGGGDLLCGGDGPDFLEGGRGNDRVDGGRGSDTAHGGPGEDRIRTGRGSVEALSGGPGADRLSGGVGSFDGLIGGAGSDRMDGGQGQDIAHFFDAPGGIVADLETDTATGHGSDVVLDIEGLVGSNFDDELRGDDGSNLLVGQEGNDTILARGSGAMTERADLLDGGPGDDVLDGGEGGDLVTFEDADTGVTVDLSLGTAAGWGSDSMSGIEGAIGSFFDDALIGDAADNAFAGGAGDDEIDGGPGVDEVAYYDARGGVVVDLTVGAATGWGSDTLANLEDVTGSARADRLVGDTLANAIEGGSGRDVLVGRAGDDDLRGGDGTDRANGGEGADACDAERELNCESDPAVGMRSASTAAWLGAWRGWPAAIRRHG